MTTVSGRADVPERLDSAPFGSMSFFATVQPDDPPLSAGALGYPTGFVYHHSDRYFRYSLSYVEFEDAPRPVTVYRVGLDLYSNTEPQLTSEMRVDGYPEEGPLDASFLDVAELTSPANPNGQHNLSEPVEWNAFDDGVIPVLELAHNYRGVSWTIRGNRNSTSLRVPQPPTGVDVYELLNGLIFEGALTLRHEAPGKRCYLRSSTAERHWYIMGN